MAFWLLAMSQPGAHGLLAGIPMAQAKPANPGWDASTRTTTTAANWRNLFIDFNKITMGARISSCGRLTKTNRARRSHGKL